MAFDLARYIRQSNRTIEAHIEEMIDELRSQLEEEAYSRLVDKDVEFTMALHPISGLETFRGKIRHVTGELITIEFTNPLNGQLRTHECTADGGRVRIVQS
jgi:predicted house-cleaning noncanonical NTP pyrophosphatase (MazG superfamily)